MNSTYNGMFLSGEVVFSCSCGVVDSRHFDFSNAIVGKNGTVEKENSLEAAYSGLGMTCPSCESEMSIRIPEKAPAGFMKRDYDSEVAGMQKSFRKRFMKKEIDDVRHKFGGLIDESLVAGEAKRIREGTVGK